MSVMTDVGFAMLIDSGKSFRYNRIENNSFYKKLRWTI